MPDARPTDRPKRVDDRVPREGETMFRGAPVADYKIDLDTGCWNWQRNLIRGYPSNKAHRDYYRRATGENIDGLSVHHKCINPSCVNPDHLEAMPFREHQLKDWLDRRGRSIGSIERGTDVRAYRVERLGANSTHTVEAFFETPEDAKDYIRALREGGDPERRTYTAVPVWEALHMLNLRLRADALTGKETP